MISQPVTSFLLQCHTEWTFKRDDGKDQFLLGHTLLPPSKSEFYAVTGVRLSILPVESTQKAVSRFLI